MYATEAVDPAQTLTAPARPRGRLRRVVIGTNELAADEAVFTGLLGWHVVERHALDDATAHRWDAPRSAGAPCVVLAPADGELADVQLVTTHRPADYRPLRSPGWAAVELLVDDLDTVMDEIERAAPARHLAVVGRPAAIGGSGGTLRAAQVVLPGGAPAYLTEINGALGAFEIPRSRRPSAMPSRGAFIVVAATTGIEPARAAFVDLLGADVVTDHELAVGVLNRAFELPPTTRHRVSTAQLDGLGAVEFDQLPAGWTPRPAAAGQLPPGVAVVGFDVPHGDHAGGIPAALRAIPPELRVELHTASGRPAAPRSAPA